MSVASDNNKNYRSQLKNFVPLGKIGQGSFSTVYKVRRVDDGKIYALKKIKLPSLSAKQKTSALTEIQILSSFRSPNIISYRQAFYDEGSQYLCLVLEWANEGDVLADLTLRKKEHMFMPESEVWRAVVDILSGLHLLHNNSVLHRDIKSANVFKSEGVYKLGDLNIAKSVLCSGLAYTQTGTPYYASPQVWREQPYDSKSDIWSFGCVVYEMCQLEPPFTAKDMKELYNSVLSGKYKPISPIYSHELRKLIACCLEVRPKDRMSCLQILEAEWVRKKIQEYRIEVRGIQSQAVKIREVEQSKAHTEPCGEGLTEMLPEPNYQCEKVQNAKKRVLLIPGKKYPTSSKRIRPHSNSSIRSKSKAKNNTKTEISQPIIPLTPISHPISHDQKPNVRNARPVSAAQIDTSKYEQKRDLGREQSRAQSGRRAITQATGIEVSQKIGKYYYNNRYTHHVQSQNRSAVLRSSTGNNSTGNNGSTYKIPIDSHKQTNQRKNIVSSPIRSSVINRSAILNRSNQLMDRTPASASKNIHTQTSNKIEKAQGSKCVFSKENISCAPYILGSVRELPRIRDILQHRNKMQRVGVKRYY